MRHKKWNKYLIACIAVFVISILPILIAAQFDYPQADDWSYSWNVYVSLKHDGLKHFIYNVVEHTRFSYFNWQGTFASIILMTMQPGIWGIRVYTLVPFIMIALVTASVMSLYYELFGRKSQKDLSWLIAGVITVAFMIQKMPYAMSGLYWYNGAIHYVGMFSFALFMTCCVLRSIRDDGKKHIAARIGACFFAVVVGGGNLISGLSVVVAYVTAIVLCLIYKRKWISAVAIPGMFNLVAFLANILAPGNMIRADGNLSNGNVGIVNTIFHSLALGVEYPFGEWFDWSYVIFVLALLPFIWEMTKYSKGTFRFPGIVILFNYGFLCTMYAPNYYVSQSADLERVNNLISLTQDLLIVFSVYYALGWLRCSGCQLFNPTLANAKVRQLQKWYFISLAIVTLFLGSLTAATDPGKFTGTLAAYELYKGTAKEFGQTAAKNIEILTSDEKDVTIKRMPEDSRLFRSDQVEPWESGTRLYFEKNTVTVAEE